MGVFRRKLFKFIFLPFRYPALLIFKDKMIASDHHFVLINLGRNAMSHHIIHFTVHFLMGKPLFFGLGHHCICNGMWEVFLQAGCKAEHIISVFPAKGDDVCHCRLGFCKSSCFIKNYGFRLSHSFQKFSSFYGDLMLLTFPHSRQNHNRHGQF